MATAQALELAPRHRPSALGTMSLQGRSGHLATHCNVRSVVLRLARENDRRLVRRRGKNKAVVATGNTQLRVLHVLLSTPGARYEDLGADYYERQREVARQVSHHVGKLGALGYEVTLCRLPPDPGTGEEDTQTA